MPVPTRWLGPVAAALLLAACGSDVAAPTLDDRGLQAEVEPVEEDATEPTDGGSSDEEADEVDTQEPGVAATEVATDVATDAPTDDDEAEAPAPDVPPAVSCTLTDEDAGIEVLSPVGGESVGTTFTMTGCGNTFEATYIYEVVLADGDVVASGFGTMTCGTGCVGTFEEEVTVSDAGPATLTVFDESAMDGSRTNIVEVDVVIVP